MRPLSALIVDDEILAVETIQDYISWKQLSIEDVFAACSLRQAQAVFQKVAVDIMLCDIEMPGGSGMELLRWVHERYPDTVTIFLTCHPNFRYAQEAIALGAANYLLKPIPFDELQMALEGAVQKRRASLENLRNRQMNEIFQEGMEETAEERSPQDLVSQVKAYIDENLDSELSCGQISRQFFLSPDYLTRIFRREENISLSEYICKCRIQFAKKLLICTQHSISLISEKAGYSHSSHFSKIFKRETGFSPADYRKKHIR